MVKLKIVKFILTYFSMIGSRFPTYSFRFATTVDDDVPEIVISIRTDPESLSNSYHFSLVSSRSKLDKSMEHLKKLIKKILMKNGLLSEDVVFVANHQVKDLRTCLVKNV